MKTTVGEPGKATTGGAWPGLIFGLLGIHMGVVALTVYFAVSDPSASIEPNYYEKAVRWDEAVARRASSERLGWDVEFQLRSGGHGRELLATLLEGSGAGIEGARVEVELFHHARAGERRTLRLEPRGSGVYAARFGAMRDGTWRVRLSASRGADVFLAERDEVFRADNAAEVPPGRMAP